MDKQRLELRAPSAVEMSAVLSWRHDARSGLRTTRLQTVEEQRKFFETVCSNPDSPHRYYSIVALPHSIQLSGMVAFGGLTNIQWENGCAEISLITNGTYKGAGGKSVDLLLEEAFCRLRLVTVYGECYTSNPALGFWEKMVERYDGFKVILPRRKFWDGELYDSLYFGFKAESWPKRK